MEPKPCRYPVNGEHLRREGADEDLRVVGWTSGGGRRSGDSATRGAAECTTNCGCQADTVAGAVGLGVTASAGRWAGDVTGRRTWRRWA